MNDRQLEKYYKLAVGILLASFLLLISAPAFGSGSAKIGGTFVNSDSSTLNGSLDYRWEEGKWQQTFESDYQYKKEDDTEVMNELFLKISEGKQTSPAGDLLHQTVRPHVIFTLKLLMLSANTTHGPQGRIGRRAVVRPSSRPLAVRPAVGRPDG